MIESLFSDYIFNDTIFSFRYLWLFCLCVIFCVISLWLCYRKSHKCQNIDLWYFILICVSLINSLKVDYRTSIFILAFIAQFGIYLFFRLCNIQVSKWIKSKIYILLASFFVFTNIIIALVISLNNNSPLAGTFKNTNFLACYITILVLPLFPLQKRYKTNKVCFIIGLLTIIAGIGTVIYLKSRTAILSIILTLIIWNISQIKLCKRTLLMGCISLFLILGLAIWGYYIKPISFHGRLLGWFVALDVIMENPIKGIGAGNVANWLNHFQAKYLAQSSSVPLKISAYSNRQLFNWYLEYIVENGLIMSIPLFSFIYFSIKKSLQVLKIKISVSDNNLNIIKGMALAVIGFLIMCLTHFPHKVVPIFMLFNIFLALVASYPLNEKKVQNNVIPKTVIYAVILMMISYMVIKLPYYCKNFVAAIEWRQAVNMSIENDQVTAQTKYDKVYTQLEWNHRFLYHYGNNQLAQNKYEKAIDLFQRAADLYPDPLMYEDLGVAYAHIYLNNPQYIEYKKQAINSWLLASNIVPWRLTPKFYLSELHYSLCNTNDAIKYAQLVVNTPMKKFSDRGVEMKKAAQKMLNELGVPCDDPGIIVFDIHERKTWNEGKW